MLAGLLFALPNLVSPETASRIPTWLPHKQVNLGLDLQGAHLLYQLDEKEMVDDWLKNIRADVRETLRSNRIGYTDLAQNVATRTDTVRIRVAGRCGEGLRGAQRSSRSRWARTCSAAFPAMTSTSPARVATAFRSRSRTQA